MMNEYFNQYLNKDPVLMKSIETMRGIRSKETDSDMDDAYQSVRFFKYEFTKDPPFFIPEQVDFSKCNHLGYQKQTDNNCVPNALNLFVGCQYF